MRQLKISSSITSREAVSLDKYLSEIGKISLLTPEEEVSLTRRIRQGDDSALDKMVSANLRFVVSVAKQYQNQGLPLSDLINEGNLGLMKAARRFDETRGFKFISYAVWWIRQSIIQALMEQARIVRLPANKAQSFNRISEAHINFLQRFEREPTDQEIGEILGLKPSEVEGLIRSGRHLSTDAPIGDDDSDATLLDFMSFEGSFGTDNFFQEDLEKEVQNTLSTLSPREMEVINDFYGLNGGFASSLEEIGERYDLTCERVRQIKERAIKRLQRAPVRELLQTYL